MFLQIRKAPVSYAVGNTLQYNIRLVDANEIYSVRLEL